MRQFPAHEYHTFCQSSEEKQPKSISVELDHPRQNASEHIVGNSYLSQRQPAIDSWNTSGEFHGTRLETVRPSLQPNLLADVRHSSTVHRLRGAHQSSVAMIRYPNPLRANFITALD